MIYSIEKIYYGFEGFLLKSESKRHYISFRKLQLKNCWVKVPSFERYVNQFQKIGWKMIKLCEFKINQGYSYLISIGQVMEVEKKLEVN